MVIPRTKLSQGEEGVKMLFGERRAKHTFKEYWGRLAKVMAS